MLPRVVPNVNVDPVLARFEARVAAVSRRDMPLAMRTVRMLQPPNWALEWCLPRWLAPVLDLDDGLVSELVLSNVLGLVSVRLEDDLADGELAASDIVRARRLAPALFDEALSVYRSRLPTDSAFWPFLTRSLREWRASSSERAASPNRAAPLKIATYGMCAMARGERYWPHLERCLDHALRALVLYDDFCDWEADLAAGRWNAFVAEAVGASRFGGEPTHAAVVVAMMTDGVVRKHFARIRVEALAAVALAQEVGSNGLATHLANFGRESSGQGEAIEARYAGAAERANALIFGRRQTEHERTGEARDGISLRT